METPNVKLKPSDIKPGMRFGNWEVIKFHHTNEHRIKYFLCKCLVCGNERPVRATALINGTSTACSKACSASLLGRTFGEWTVLKVDKSHPSNYICRCSCGTIKSIFRGSLKQGMSKSCGCKKSQDAKQRNLDRAESHIGERYGKLVITGCELRNENYWFNCHCDCGTDVSILSSRVLNKNGTRSCGCINSKANEEMAVILNKLNVPYKREYKFEDCRGIAPLPFDFAIFNQENELVGLIELNGAQHYQPRTSGWFTKDVVAGIQKRDYIKMQFCLNNNIPLLVIPYQYFDEIEKFLTSSNFWNIITKNLND